MSSTPPVAPRKPATSAARHGRRRTDDYAWLKDENWQQVMHDPTLLRSDIRAYLEAENAYKDAALAPTQALRAALFDEFRGRIKEDDSSVPAKDGAWEYYHRYREGGQHPVVCRRQAGDPARDVAGGKDGDISYHVSDHTAGDTVADAASEQVLLDGDAEAEGKSYYRVGGRGHTWNHRRFAWTVDENGSEFYTLRVKDLETGRRLDDAIERCSGGFVWAADHQTLFYTVLDDNHRPCKVFRHRLGADVADDALVYEESDAGFFLNVALTESRRFVVIDAHDHVTSEVRLIEADQPDGTAILVAARDPDTEYDVSHHGDRLIILTNAGGAEDFKIVEAPIASPGRAHWVDLVPHRPGVLIAGFEVYATVARAAGARERSAADRGARPRIAERSTRSRSRRRRTASGSPAATSSTPIRCGSRTPRCPPPSTYTTTTCAPVNASCARCRRCRAGTSPPTTSPAASWPHRTTARRCRSRCCITRTPRSTAPLRCCCTVTARTGCRCRRRSPPRA